jgi:hypothetical protein
MKKMPSKVLLLCLALLGVPLLFGILCGMSYKYDYFPSEATQFVVLAACVVAGMVMISALPLEPKWRRYMASILYGAVMSGCLVFVAIGVACSNGNCL